jgi:hypothetical protein
MGVAGGFLPYIRPKFSVALVRVTIQEISKTLIGKIRGQVQCGPPRFYSPHLKEVPVITTVASNVSFALKK